MAQRRSLGSIAKRDNGSWLVRVTVPTAGGGQKRKSKTVRGSKRDAEKVLQTLLAEQGHADGGLTFGQFIELHYCPWHDAKYPRRDSKDQFHRMMGYLTDEFADRKLDSLSTSAMEAWAEGVPEYKVNAMKAALNKAVDWDMLGKNPLRNVKPHRARPKKGRFSLEDAALIVEAFRGTDLEAAVLLMLMGGFRREEALAMDWNRIDFKTGLAKIDRTWHYGEGEGWFEDTKNPTSRRVVTLDRRTLSRLDEIRRAGGVMRMGAVCETRPGVRMPPSTCADKWAAVAKPLLGSHCLPMKNLRHTHASICLEGGVPMEAISKRLGHASTKLTESTYAEAPQIQEQCADAMLRAFGA